MFLPSDNHLAYFRTFPCVDVQNCTISDTKTAIVQPFWRFLKTIWLKDSLNVFIGVSLDIGNYCTFNALFNQVTL